MVGPALDSASPESKIRVTSLESHLALACGYGVSPVPQRPGDTDISLEKWPRILRWQHIGGVMRRHEGIRSRTKSSELSR